MSTAEPPPEDAPDRTCPTCGSGMAREQDWCLECGTAAPGRLGGLRPGWRAVGTTLALTLVLVGGAGAASYAALSSDADRASMAAVPADATPVAQAPPVVAAPPAPVQAPPPTLKAVTPRPPAAVKQTPVVPETPVAPETPAAQTPAPVTPTPTPPTKTTTTDTTKTPAPSQDAPEKPRAIALGADTVAVYDPYHRADGAGDPADAYDGDAGTALAFRGPDDGGELQVGVVVDLESATAVRTLELHSKVPGARLEVYTTASAKLPADVLDPRWDHPASRRTLEAEERIELFAKPRRVRYVLLWFTAPPAGSAYVGVRELSLLA